MHPPVKSNPSDRMASPGASEPPEEAPDVSNVRLYSDFLLYFSKAGRLQHHPLLDGPRNRGVLSLLGSERVTKLTGDRRMRPVVLTMVPGTPPQRVYLVAIVRESKFSIHRFFVLVGP